MEFIQSFALVGMVLLGFGIIFRVVRPRAVIFFILFLLFFPVLLSVIKGFGVGLLGSHLSWQAWLVIILGILIGLRIFIDRIFRR